MNKDKLIDSMGSIYIDEWNIEYIYNNLIFKFEVE